MTTTCMTRLCWETCHQQLHFFSSCTKTFLGVLWGSMRLLKTFVKDALGFGGIFNQTRHWGSWGFSRKKTMRNGLILQHSWESHSSCRSRLAQRHLTLCWIPWFLLPFKILPRAICCLWNLLSASENLLHRYVWKPCPGRQHLERKRNTLLLSLSPNGPSHLLLLTKMDLSVPQLTSGWSTGTELPFWAGQIPHSLTSCLQQNRCPRK